MNITIGIAKSERELTLSTDKSVDELTEIVTKAFETGMLVLDDTKNGRFIVPVKRVSYVNIGEKRSQPVGFAS